MKKELSAKDSEAFLTILKNRFEKNTHRHKNIDWANVHTKLKANSAKLWQLHEMEKTGGEPDVVNFDRKTNKYIFYDCAAESPTGRRSLCYDKKAHDSRKENKPKGSAMDIAAAMGIEILTEQQYSALQQLENFDTKTSSWVLTPDAIRNLGGALFCDRRYNTVFLYHNGAESYYAARGFRALLSV